MHHVAYLELELLVDLNKQLHNKDNQRACTNPIVGKPEIAGITAFHAHITGNAVKIAITAASPIRPTTVAIAPKPAVKIDSTEDSELRRDMIVT